MLAYTTAPVYMVHVYTAATMGNTALIYTTVFACTAAPVHATARVYTTASANNAALVYTTMPACIGQ
eukprot:4024417-Pyramimonas_sp.AAC.1